LLVIFSDSGVVYKEPQLFSATTLDIVLGVLFGIVALVIICVAGHLNQNPTLRPAENILLIRNMKLYMFP
jgi:hypothetical protein